MSWHLFDRIRSLARSANIYQQERLFQDQTSLSRIMAGGELLDFSQQQALLDQTNLQINRLERYKDYDQMDETGEMSLALDLYADEASLVDPERKHTIIIKAESKTVKEELEDLFFNQLLIDNQIRPMVRYLCKYGDSPFEIVPTVDRDGVASLKFINVYNFTRIETKHGDLVGFFHQDEVMEEPQFLHPWQVMHLRLTDYGNIYHPYGKCQDVLGPIDTPTGYKRLRDLQPGDDIYSWDGNKAVPTKVVKFVSNGIKPTIIIKTRHYTTPKLTKEHPVLVASESGQRYVQAGDIKIGDKLVIPKIEFGQSEIKINKKYIRYKFNEDYRGQLESSDIGYKKTAKDLDLSVNITRGFLRRGNAVLAEHADKILKYHNLPGEAKIGSGWGTYLDCTLPQYVDNDFARFFGFMLGDGWLSKSSVQFALGEDNDLNEYYVGLLDKYSGESKIGFRYNRNNKPIAAIVNNAVLSNTLFDMGLNAKASGKSIPNWAFETTADIAVSLVQGLLDSDGCEYLDKGKYLRFYHSTASEDLAIGLKSILHRIGVKCSHICSGRNHKFNSSELGNLRYQLTYWQSELGFEDDGLYENVIQIDDAGDTEVGDIQVESPYHNFISNNIVVHNSVIEGGRKAFKQLRMMEDAALIYRICLRWDTPIWTPNGHKIIKDLEVGDKVYSYDKAGNLVDTEVTKHYSNGYDRMMRIASRHREIFCNPTHPILVETVVEGKNVQIYVDARDIVPKKHRFILPSIPGHTNYAKLSKSDVPRYMRIQPLDIASLKYKPSYIALKVGLKESTVRSFLSGSHDLIYGRAECLMEFIGVDPESQSAQIISGWSFNPHKGVATEYSIPDLANEDFARWFGFMIGDGYVSQRRHCDSTSITSEIGFACGDDEECNARYRRLFEEFVGEVKFAKDDKRLGKYYVYSVHLADFMIMNGFVPGAANKRIPDWVYQSPKAVQEAFIDGYIDADGWRRNYVGGVTEGNEVECCNEMLLRDLKELIHQIGWTAGNVRRRIRDNGHVIDHDDNRIMQPTESWSLYFTKKPAPRTEAILAAEFDDYGEVYDITVASELHNFVAGGIPVSNTRAPEKRIFKIPIGNIPAKDVPEFMQSIARIFKNQRFYDPRTGQFNERFSPLIQEDDFFLPVRPDGTSPSIDTLKGAENLDQIADIEYFKKKMVAPTKIPFKRVGVGEGAGEEQEKSLSASDAQFAKAVQWIQREVSVGLTKVAICHLAMAGYTIGDLKEFEIGMSASSAIEELYRMETWQGRTSVMSDLKDLGWFPREWIVTRFTDLSPDEIQELQEIMTSEAEIPEDEGGLGGLGGLGGELGGLGGGEGELPEIAGEGPEVEGGAEELEVGAEGGEEGGAGAQADELVAAAGLGEYLDRRYRNIIKEIKSESRRKTLIEFIEKVDKRVNRPKTKPYDFLMNSNELDGLRKGNKQQILVESSVPRDVRKQVVIEFYSLLTDDE